MLTLFVVLLLAVLAAIVISRNLKAAVFVLFWGGIGLSWVANPVLGACLTIAALPFLLLVKLLTRR